MHIYYTYGIIQLYACYKLPQLSLRKCENKNYSTLWFSYMCSKTNGCWCLPNSFEYCRLNTMLFNLPCIRYVYVCLFVFVI